MKQKTINNRTMQKSNMSLVLKTILDSSGISRKALAEETGLTPSTVTNIANRLLEEGYILETGAGESDVGRKPIILEINRDKAYIVGVELSADQIIGVITGFGGEIRFTAVQKRDQSAGAQATLGELCGLVCRLMETAGADREHVLGVGVMSAGPYEREQGVMVNSPNFGWKGRVPVRDFVRETLGVPAYFDRDSVGCAMAETDSARCREYPVIFAVMVNTIGIGGGLMIDGEVFYGTDNAAAEIGHLTVEPGGPNCNCGDAGCLEAVSSGNGILSEIGRRIAQGEKSVLAGIPDLTVEDVVRAYRQGDALCVRTVAHAADCLVMAIDNVIKTVSPGCVVLGGSFMALLPEYFELVASRAGQRVYEPVFKPTPILPFSYGEVQSAMGGVRLVQKAFFEALNN